jgi:hypothetical protein
MAYACVPLIKKKRGILVSCREKQQQYEEEEANKKLSIYRSRLGRGIIS